MPKKENRFSFELEPIELEPNKRRFDGDFSSDLRAAAGWLEPVGSMRAGFCVKAPCIATQAASHMDAPRTDAPPRTDAKRTLTHDFEREEACSLHTTVRAAHGFVAHVT